MSDTKTESPAEKFERLAVARVNRALKDVALIGNLGSTQYDKTEGQVDSIESALLAAVESTMARLRHVKESRPTFTL